MTSNSKHDVSFLNKKEKNNSLIQELHYKYISLRLYFVITKRSLQFFLQTNLIFISRKSYLFIKKLKFQLFYYRKFFVL